ncbi:MAG: hypothetical protein K9I37_01070 [Crocinitomicaceae bacterium]|nr:hypothetical protein [Crocinitomicaceae bacterium]
MKKLISSISMHIKAIEEQDINLEDLDFLVTQCNLLQEQLIILRYKVYEEMAAKNNGDKSPEVKSSVPAFEAIEETVIETIETPVVSETPVIEVNDTPPASKPFDFSLFSDEEEALLEPESDKTIEEHYSETTTIEDEHGITEETIIKEHAATIEEGDSIIVINKEEVTTISFSNESEDRNDQHIVASDHPMIAQFRAMEKNIRGERAILPLESLAGSFTLTEKLQYINALFGGSSEAFGTAVKNLNEQQNMAGAILVLIGNAESNAWNFVKSFEIIEEFVLKICRRYANSPAA